MSVRWPAVYDGLVTIAQTLASDTLTVYDGPAAQPPRGDRLEVGAGPDGDAGGWDTARGSMDVLHDETGTVRALFTVQDGGRSPSETRTRAAGYVAAISAAVEADQTLGGALSTGSTVDVAVTVRQPQTTSGVLVEADLTFTYFTRTS